MSHIGDLAGPGCTFLFSASSPFLLPVNPPFCLLIISTCLQVAASSLFTDGCLQTDARVGGDLDSDSGGSGQSQFSS